MSKSKREMKKFIKEAKRKIADEKIAKQAEAKKQSEKQENSITNKIKKWLKK